MYLIRKYNEATKMVDRSQTVWILHKKNSRVVTVYFRFQISNKNYKNLQSNEYDTNTTKKLFFRNKNICSGTQN